MEKHASLTLLLRHGGILAAAVFIGTVAGAGGIALSIGHPIFWLALALSAAAAASFFVLVLRDIAKVIADTLMPGI